MKKLRFNALCTALATLVLHSCTTAPAYALMPIRWVADGAKPDAYATQIAQGETRELICTLKNYGAPVSISDSATATLYYQTNGMGSAYWPAPASVTTNGVITATWSPALDAGAAVYSFALGVEDGTNLTYTAYGILRMRLSPGHVPNTLPLPRQSLDLAIIDILNAPWATPADIEAITPETIGAVRGDKIGSMWEVTGGIMTGDDTGRSTELKSSVLIFNNNTDGVGLDIFGGNGLVGEDNISWLWPDTNTDSPLIKRDDLEDYALPKTGGTMTGLLTLFNTGAAWPDIATNVVYHVVVSNGHWLIKEVQ